MSKSSFGLIGLGVMGKSLALNILRNNFSLSVYNRKTEEEAHLLTDFLKENSHQDLVLGFSDLKDFVRSLESPRKILLMVSAGSAVDHVIKNLMEFLDKGDIIIDGGNSHYKDTERRIDQVKKQGIHYLGCGISGGEEGALKGPSIMPGGAKKAYNEVSDVLESIAAKDANNLPCCSFIGPGGAGNFVKTIHNGIEYAEMQLIAECYDVMRQTKSNEEIADLFEGWNKSDLSSYLLGITVQILRKKEGDRYLVDLILDKAANKGTGSWSSQISLGNGMPTTMMTDAVFARYVSSFKKVRSAISEKVSRKTGKKDVDESIIEDAYRFARLINHQQGFSLINELSKSNSWDIDLSSIARVWTNGCIIRSALMEDLIQVFKNAQNMLDSERIIQQLSESEEAVSLFLKNVVENKIPAPVISSAYQYWLGMSTGNLPANLIQAQRDFFGAHTYERIDAKQGDSFHTNW
ncbi:MAG: NADP-dependent phosphogluconate dehydrogenase [Bacteroidota bacterium]